MARAAVHLSPLFCCVGSCYYKLVADLQACTYIIYLTHNTKTHKDCMPWHSAAALGSGLLHLAVVALGSGKQLLHSAVVCRLVLHTPKPLQRLHELSIPTNANTVTLARSCCHSAASLSCKYTEIYPIYPIPWHAAAALGSGLQACVSHIFPGRHASARTAGWHRWTRFCGACCHRPAAPAEGRWCGAALDVLIQLSVATCMPHRYLQVGIGGLSPCRRMMVWCSAGCVDPIVSGNMRATLVSTGWHWWTRFCGTCCHRPAAPAEKK